MVVWGKDTCAIIPPSDHPTKCRRTFPLSFPALCGAAAPPPPPPRARDVAWEVRFGGCRADGISWEEAAAGLGGIHPISCTFGSGFEIHVLQKATRREARER